MTIGKYALPCDAANDGPVTDHTPTHRDDDDRWHVRLGRALAGWGQDGAA